MLAAGSYPLIEGVNLLSNDKGELRVEACGATKPPDDKVRQWIRERWRLAVTLGAWTPMGVLGYRCDVTSAWTAR